MLNKNTIKAQTIGDTRWVSKDMSLRRIFGTPNLYQNAKNLDFNTYHLAFSSVPSRYQS